MSSHVSGDAKSIYKDKAQDPAKAVHGSYLIPLAALSFSESSLSLLNPFVGKGGPSGETWRHLGT